MKYEDFLSTKYKRSQFYGKDIPEKKIHPKLFDFQRKVTTWAIRKGRAALFLDTGLGKTFCQLEWARLLNQQTLILAPLSVARQTVREGRKIGMEIPYCRDESEIDNKICITNYEMLDRFSKTDFGAVVLDESSILKSLNSKTRQKLIRRFKNTPYRLACTATPAPNDYTELGNHAEFLGICNRNEMLSEFFVHANKVKQHILWDGTIVNEKQSNKLGQVWRLKYHAQGAFFQWLASWAMSMKTPEDLGFCNNGFKLPPLNIKPEYVNIEATPAPGQLFFGGLKGIQHRLNIRRQTLSKRAVRLTDIVKGVSGQWIIWCGLQAEADKMMELLPDAKQVKGPDKPEYKAEIIESFQDGKFRIMITKPRIAGFGMNFQNAHRMAFMGLGDSWEQYYQCIRRQWRFGQTEPVDVYLMLSDVEAEIYHNVLRKEKMAMAMHKQMMNKIKVYEQKELSQKSNMIISHKTETIEAANYKMLLGDAVERLAELETESIDLSVYSPPFADLYTYSATERDLGNCRDWLEFFKHYKYIIEEIYRITKIGRNSCVHTADIPALAVKDGYIGLRDFAGEVIKVHEQVGWIFWGRAIVSKNPQAQAIRTKAKALLFAQLRKNSAECRPAILDQILIFKKPGDSIVAVKPVENGEMDNETWIDWAGGIWTGIYESDTLKHKGARDKDDEKHICPLQLGTIERCIKLYSNPGEIVLTPFGGIGSESYQALRFGRKTIYIELKESYFQIAVKHIKRIEQEMAKKLLFPSESPHKKSNTP